MTEDPGLSAKKLALLRRRLAGEHPATSRFAIRRRTDDGPAPLSFAQQRLWFLDQLVPNSALYNVLNAIPISAAIDAGLLEAAIREIVRRHDVLRTRFELLDGTPVAIADAEPTVHLQVVDLREHADSASEAVAITNAEARQPFDLARGPLLRAVLIRTDDATATFIVTMHHIVSDGWSMGIFFAELNALYESFGLGRPSPLPDLQIQYADYAAWQRSEVERDIKHRQLPYWRAQLDRLPTLQLPTDRPRGAVQTFRGANAPIGLSATVTDALRALSRAEGVTLFMTTLAAFVALLTRHTDQHDIVVGSPIAGRGRTELEPLIGFFVNTVVLRTRTSPDMTFRGLLHVVQQTALDAYANQDLPFEMLVEELHPQRDLGRNPMFQVMFQLLTSAGGGSADAADPGRDTPPAPTVTVDTAKFDLTVSLHDYGGSVVGSVEYNTDLFDGDTIDRLAGHFQQLAGAAAGDPDLPIADLPLEAPDATDLVVRRTNDTARDYPRDTGIADLFREQVERHGDLPAVTASDITLTYRDLDAAGNRLAHLLLAQPDARGAPVALLLPRSLDHIVATLATIKAAATYLPLDPSYPPARLAAMLADAGSRVVLTTTDHAPNLPDDWAGSTVFLDERRADIDARPDTAPGPLPSMTGDHAAYVMYTSGSTGDPKGVIVPHRAIARLVKNTDYIDIRPGDRLGHAANCSFDAATFEIWGALLNGAHLVVLPRATTLSPQAFADALHRGVDILFLTTALFNQLAQAVPGAFSDVRDLLFGGESPDLDSVRAVLHDGPPHRILHVYGPTESTTFAAWHLVHELGVDATSLPVGRPIANTTLYVLDGHLRHTAVGLPGELHIGGDGLAHGYLHQPAHTADRFRPDPHGLTPGGRLYATGDLARRNPDGTIDFLGRIDRQFKIRGFRIEPGDIEAALQRHPDVRQCAVAVRSDPTGEPQLVAYLVAGGAAPSAADLRAHLREQLPEHMVPTHYVSLAALPLTPNGKLDMQALPEPERAGQHAGPVVTTNATQQVIAETWRDVLHLDHVGLDDNFFDLGGHSLLVAKVHNRLAETVAKPLTLIDMFQFPTIRSLAAHADQLRPDPDLTGSAVLRTPEPSGNGIGSGNGAATTDRTAGVPAPTAGPSRHAPNSAVAPAALPPDSRRPLDDHISRRVAQQRNALAAQRARSGNRRRTGPTNPTAAPEPADQDGS